MHLVTGYGARFAREFAPLAAIGASTVALDLVFVELLSFDHLASLALAFLLTLAASSLVRLRFARHRRRADMLAMERMFDRIYRVARTIEAQPQRAPNLVSQLLREIFEPSRSELIDATPCTACVDAGGAGLVVPLPSLAGRGCRPVPAGAIRLSVAPRRRRVFTVEDAHLADRVVEQLRTAVTFDVAVEQGRDEERNRIAQDLHDDIGARLLTLMYRAQSMEIEEYLRHTLQELKTLTRGLTAGSHSLNDAAAEWKADLTQRLNVANVELGWHVDIDNDRELNVVQWSALTRILRELVSNVIAHAQARRVEIDLQIDGDRLDLSVTDNGTGGDPARWSHGLGLGGVRKRVRQLGGEVEWRVVEPCGISCRVRIPALSASG